jgi:general stress protein 26
VGREYLCSHDQDIENVVEVNKTLLFENGRFMRRICARHGTGLSHGVRPRSVQKVDDQDACWLLSANVSNKNCELEYDDSVDLYFQGSVHSDFVLLSGAAEAPEDKAKIKELWVPIAKTWFTGGENDPRISVTKSEIQHHQDMAKRLSKLDFWENLACLLY